MRTLGCGHLYVTISRDDNGHDPLEVLATLGKAGSCSVCQNEALTRVITLGLRHGVPAQDFVEELQGITCPYPHLGSPSDRNRSCADAIANAMREYLEDR